MSFSWYRKLMSQRTLQVGIATAIAVGVVLFFLLFNNPFMVPNDLNNAANPATPQGGGLVIQDQTVGSGADALSGKMISVHYTGRLQDGTVFDSSVGKTPFQFTLGSGQVIAGWDQGIQGMKAGGKRLLIIPPQLGYGNVDYGPIPANSTLIFEVELLSVQ